MRRAAAIGFGLALFLAVLGILAIHFIDLGSSDAPFAMPRFYRHFAERSPVRGS